MTEALILGFVALVAVIFVAALSPFEALGWWAGWFGRTEEAEAAATSPSGTGPPPKHFVVFLTGIHTVSDETHARREQNLLERLRARLPDALITEIFPYSVENRALTGQRFFASFWRLALRLKLSRVAVAGLIINARNIFQVAVSADHRYGPIYNQGTAETLYRALLERGYRKGGDAGVTLVGYSGGGQIALGAAGPLKKRLGSNVTVISLGGIMASDESLLEIDSLYHLVGTRDRVQLLGPLLFPGRWPLLPYSAWNQAKARGIINIIPMGPVDHTGKDGYLDSKFTLPDGRSSLEQTVDVMAELISGKARV